MKRTPKEPEPPRRSSLARFGELLMDVAIRTPIRDAPKGYRAPWSGLYSPPEPKVLTWASEGPSDEGSRGVGSYLYAPRPRPREDEG
jgi:hypothetical protein